MCSALRAPWNRHIKHIIIRLLCCCRKSSQSSPASKSSSEEEEEEGVVMGPLTLRDYVNTLEPYDPWVHGWRGQEPRRVWASPSELGKPSAGKRRRHAHK